MVRAGMPVDVPADPDLSGSRVPESAPSGAEADLDNGSEFPRLPLGDRIWLRGRGTMFVRRVEGPPGAKTIVLAHGWLASGGLNWFQCFDALGEHFNVLAPDLRGHGRGIRTLKPFRLADCADDLAALIEREQCGPVIAVGYSMGGPVVQLLWRRHPELVAGLGLCATGAEFVTGNRERYGFTTLMTVAATTTRVGQLAAFLPGLVTKTLFGIRPTKRPGTFARWARSEMGRHNPRAILEAGHAIGTYSAKHWVHEIDVPTSVLITTRDRAIDPTAQSRLAMAIPNAHINRIDDGHIACANPDFGRKITDCVLDIERRIDGPDRRRNRFLRR